MNKFSPKTKFLVILLVLVTVAPAGIRSLNQCFERPQKLEVPSVEYIKNLYPWPGAKIPFACHVLVFLKSPLAPTQMSDFVFKEDGFRILGGQRRDGVIAADILVTEELWHLFPEPLQSDVNPAFADSVILYVDGKELQIGHIGYRDFDLEFNVATILNPFLWPGEHIGKIVILLPSGETLQYEWQFEITW